MQESEFRRLKRLAPAGFYAGIFKQAFGDACSLDFGELSNLTQIIMAW
jgi:hypothetical protein